jgi:hypothetical protein
MGQSVRHSWLRGVGFEPTTSRIRFVSMLSAALWLSHLLHPIRTTSATALDCALPEATSCGGQLTSISLIVRETTVEGSGTILLSKSYQGIRPRAIEGEAPRPASFTKGHIPESCGQTERDARSSFALLRSSSPVQRSSPGWATCQSTLGPGIHHVK